MTPQLASRELRVRTGSPIVDQLRILGTILPNLVLVQDSGKPFEFRVQCEVILDPADAMEVHTGLADKTVKSLQHVEDIVTKHMDPAATANFRKIVELAFADNYNELGEA